MRPSSLPPLPPATAPAATAVVAVVEAAAAEEEEVDEGNKGREEWKEEEFNSVRRMGSTERGREGGREEAREADNAPQAASSAELIFPPPLPSLVSMLGLEG